MIESPKNPMHQESDDSGHKSLLDDLVILVTEASAYEFHDFKNTSYAAPKMELYKQLTALAENVKNGRYDNKPSRE